MTTILIVDDQLIIRQGLRKRLELEPDLQVVGEACNGNEALLMAETLAPAIIVMDVAMPELDGIKATALLKATNSSTQVIMLSIYYDDPIRERAYQAGARAFVYKQGVDKLLEAIREAMPPE